MCVEIIAWNPVGKCPSQGVGFRASEGVYVSGSITPALADVIVSIVNVNTGAAVATVKTDQAGKVCW